MQLQLGAARGRVTLYVGAWQRFASEFPASVVLITDPPYGIGHESSWPGRFQHRQIAGDSSTAERDEALERIAWTVAAVFGSSKMPTWSGALGPDGEPLEERHRIVATLIMDKGPASGMGDLSIPWRHNYEVINVYGRGWAGERSSSVVRGRVPTWSGGLTSAHRVNRYHPHEKPLAVLGELVDKAPAGVILDPFAGSGTTLIAAALAGRDAIGCEVDALYAETIVGRLRSVGVEVNVRGE